MKHDDLYDYPSFVAIWILQTWLEMQDNMAVSYVCLVR